MDKQKLLSQIEAGTERLGTTIKAAPWGHARFYANWCAQTYKYVVHSAPLIKLCAEVLPGGDTKKDMEHHYQEEVGHEKFAARDAEALGIDAVGAEEFGATTAIYRDVYDEIRANPVAMFGYALALENLSKRYGPWIAEKVIASYHIRPSPNHTKNVPASFLTLHADVDQAHAEEGLAAIDQIAPEDLPVVSRVMEKTFTAYERFLRTIEVRSA